MRTVRTRRFLVLHGWQNHRPPQHWQWQLVEALREDGEQVLYPQFPAPDAPSRDDWSELLHDELAQLGGGERILIAHSLGVSLWLAVAPSVTSAEHLDRVLLVAPPSPQVLRANVEVARFAEAPHDTAALNRAATTTRLVYSDNDPYCPEGAQHAYRALDVDADVIPGAGHLNPDAGYGWWPAALDWCRDPATRLTARPTPG